MTRLVARFLPALFVMCLVAPAAHATQYNGLRVFKLQHPLAVPHPVNPDTVLNVRGIVTGFDPFPVGYAIYIQDRGSNPDQAGNPWTGLDLFMGGSAEHCNFALGDSVLVSGKMQEFQGETEIEGLDPRQDTPDITVTKISSGHPLPAFHVGTVAELKEVPFASPAGADSVREKWEGMLVRVNGPLRVVRTSLTGGMGTFSSFLVVNNVVCPDGAGGPCDSMFVDGSTLSFSAVFPPSVSTILTYAQGIYNQRNRGYRIQLQSAEDIGGNLQPNLVDAFTIAPNTYQVVMDRGVTAGSAQDEINFRNSSLNNPISAVLQSDPTRVNLTFTPEPALPDSATYSITLENLVAAATNTPMTDIQSRNFTNGVLRIIDIQEPAPDSLAPALPSVCKDVTPFVVNNNGNTSRLTFRGVATAQIGSSAFVQDAAGVPDYKPGQPRHGLQVFAPSCVLVPGRQYLIAAQITEFGAGGFNNNNKETETQGSVYVVDEGAVTPIQPTIQTVQVLKDNTCDGAQSIVNGEDYEGMLVKVQYGKVIRDAQAGRAFTIRAPGGGLADTIKVDSTGYSYDPNLDDVVSVTGIHRFFATTTPPTGAQFRIQPRNDGDIKFHGVNVDVPGTALAKVSFSVHPNPAKVARIDFGLPRKDVVELAVFDVQGRKLAVLANGLMEAGTYSRQWDGVMGSGKRAGAGVYFYRLKVGREEFNIRGVRIE